VKIATFNVNGVNGRLSVLLRWLAMTEPDVVCLQELKAPDDKFPEPALRQAGYRAIWHGQKSFNGVAILARRGQPIETRRGLPGEPDDTHSRYIEAAVDGVLIGCIYLPNGNPAPGTKFDYKLRWFARLAAHAADLLATGMPVVLAGDFNVMQTDLDVYKPERWVDDALFRPEVREAFHRLVAQGSIGSLHKDGPTLCAQCTRASVSTPSGTTSGTLGFGMPACGSTICCSARQWRTVSSRRMWTGRCAAGKGPATMRPSGSSSPNAGPGKKTEIQAVTND
jgi:exodeoxyribonuclease-3